MTMTTNKAGRELDALVAEKVMGLPVKRDGAGRHGVASDYLTLAEPGNPAAGWWYVPEFSADIAAAWQVVNALAERGSGWWRFGQFGWGWDAYWMEGRADDAEVHAHAQAETMPLAICLAALAAVEVDHAA